ncbi:uncharacterized protein LOC133370361 [Rhineura floridana]|uniref:uncharacterized protein LOC133370361 n=1 Tax=Rhineura floridana TaxID=261503 RepID=UPI002AC7FAB7|nr:uncharacterized protein LOC133370361 [Rhineura floridana]
MAPSLKRKFFEQDHASAESPSCCFQEHKRRSLLHTALGKYATVVKPNEQDLYKTVLLRNTILHLQENGIQPRSQGNQEMVFGPMSQSAPPCQETSLDCLPESHAPESPTSLMEPSKEPQRAVDNGQAKAFEMGNSACAPSAFSSDIRLPGLLLDPFLYTAGELLYFREGLQQQEVGSGPSLSPAGPRAEYPSGWPSEDAAANPRREAGIWDALSREELLCDPLFGSFEILTSSYASDLPADDLFSDIDTSEFESTLGALPSDAQLPFTGMADQAAAGNLPQAEALPLPRQNAREISSLDRYMEFLLSS